jgi:hypothetical protein|tara:strand:+ start:190 stop:501 length:312 start_codon:yes stop_codon:yes gene_type:complete
MILKKVIIGLFFICFLNGCVQSTTLLGPAYTLVSTGNAYHAGLSYGSSHAVKKITGKTPTENIKNLIVKKEITVEEEENFDEFFALVKSRVDKTHKIINSTNQ